MFPSTKSNYFQTNRPENDNKTKMGKERKSSRRPYTLSVC